MLSSAKQTYQINLTPQVSPPRPEKFGSMMQMVDQGLQSAVDAPLTTTPIVDQLLQRKQLALGNWANSMSSRTSQKERPTDLLR